MTVSKILRNELSRAWAALFASSWRLSKHWARAKKRVKKRANGRCEVTGERLKVGHVHHLEDASNNKDLIFEDSNLIFVSPEVHKAYHIDYMGGWEKQTSRKTWNRFVKVYLRNH